MFLKSLYALVPTLGLTIIAQGYISDPIPDEVTSSELGAKLVKVFEVPQSSTTDPQTRIVRLREPDDGSGRLFVGDQRGQLWVSVNKEPPMLFLDLRNEITPFIENDSYGVGFASFDFHPNFATNGKFYTIHTEVANTAPADFPLPNEGTEGLQAVLTEWTTSDPAANSWAGSRRDLMRVEITGQSNAIQDISFNKSATANDEDFGLLYLAIGDGNSYGEGQLNQAYTLSSLLGTILRIDPLGNNSENGAYGIPASNPFIDNDSSTLDEIYALGFRNPEGITWDLDGDHKMFAGDIGERNIEELNFIEPGLDYGWPYREGTFVFDPLSDPNADNNGRTNRDWVYALPPDDSTFGYTYAVAQYDHYDNSGTHIEKAISTGYVFRDPAIPSLNGQYAFGDALSGEIYIVPVEDLVQNQTPANYSILKLYDEDDIEVTLRLLLLRENRRYSPDFRFGQDNSGALYILSQYDGWIRQFVRATNDPIEPTSSWAGFPIADLPPENGTWVDTGEWLGWIEVSNAVPSGIGWIYLFDLNSWAYTNAPSEKPKGLWMYLMR